MLVAICFLTIYSQLCLVFYFYLLNTQVFFSHLKRSGIDIISFYFHFHRCCINSHVNCKAKGFSNSFDFSKEWEKSIYFMSSIALMSEMCLLLLQSMSLLYVLVFLYWCLFIVDVSYISSVSCLRSNETKWKAYLATFRFAVLMTAAAESIRNKRNNKTGTMQNRN